MVLGFWTMLISFLTWCHKKRDTSAHKDRKSNFQVYLFSAAMITQLLQDSHNNRNWYHVVRTFYITLRFKTCPFLSNEQASERYTLKLKLPITLLFYKMLWEWPLLPAETILVLNAWQKPQSSEYKPQFPFLAFAGALVGLQLHEVGAGAGEGLVKVDQAQMGAGAFTITCGTWVWS